MRTILSIILISLAVSLQAQTKQLQEQFGFWRIHAVESFHLDTAYNEDGTFYKVQEVANMLIYREGIDGQYNVVISETVFNNVNKTIDYLAVKPEYLNFKIIQK